MNLFRGNESGRGHGGGALAGAEAGALYRAASPGELALALCGDPQVVRRF